MIFLKQPLTNKVIEAPEGFSWTTAIFGFFVPFYRGMFVYGLIFLALSVVSFGIVGIFYPFVMNKHYVKFLLQQGYKPFSLQDSRLVMALDIGYQPEKRS